MSKIRKRLLIVTMASVMVLAFLAGAFAYPLLLGASTAALTNGQRAAVMGGQLLLYENSSRSYLPLIVR